MITTILFDISSRSLINLDHDTNLKACYSVCFEYIDLRHLKQGNKQVQHYFSCMDLD